MQQHYIEVHMKNGEIFYYTRTTESQYANFIFRYDDNSPVPELIGLKKSLEETSTSLYIFKINEVNFLKPVGMNVDRDENGAYIVTFV